MDQAEGPLDEIMENFACREEATHCPHDHIDPLCNKTKFLPLQSMLC